VPREWNTKPTNLKFTDDWRLERVLAATARGAPRTLAAKAAQIDRATIGNWVDEGKRVEALVESGEFNPDAHYDPETEFDLWIDARYYLFLQSYREAEWKKGEKYLDIGDQLLASEDEKVRQKTWQFLVDRSGFFPKQESEVVHSHRGHVVGQFQITGININRPEVQIGPPPDDWTEAEVRELPAGNDYSDEE
jgi:hypothetical protein